MDRRSSPRRTAAAEPPPHGSPSAATRRRPAPRHRAARARAPGDPRPRTGSPGRSAPPGAPASSSPRSCVKAVYPRTSAIRNAWTSASRLVSVWDPGPLDGSPTDDDSSSGGITRRVWTQSRSKGKRCRFHFGTTPVRESPDEPLGERRGPRDGHTGRTAPPSPPRVGPPSPSNRRSTTLSPGMNVTWFNPNGASCVARFASSQPGDGFGDVERQMRERDQLGLAPPIPSRRGGQTRCPRSVRCPFRPPSSPFPFDPAWCPIHAHRRVFAHPRYVDCAMRLLMPVPTIRGAVGTPGFPFWAAEVRPPQGPHPCGSARCP